MSGIGGELIDFLLPKTEDPLQVGFLLIIVTMIVYTTVSAHWAARPASWEKKWNRGTPDRDDDDLDIEHGSVTDLWHAVATSSEKLAEIMPGMLLVVGLLGTFLGLGMALDHASTILGQSNAVADSMGDLLGLLQGLGTKFKTSTWGIMGFVLLKIWSEVTRFDEKRLIWVIDKVKVELDRRARERRAAEEGKQRELFEQISRASAHIVDGICAAVSQADRSQQHLLTAMSATLTQTHGEAKDALLRANDRVLQSLDASREALAQGFDRVDQRLQQSHSEMEALLLSSAGTIHETLAGIQETQQASSEVLTNFTQGTQEIVQQMADAAKVMASGAGKVSSAAQGLEKVVHEFGSEFRNVLDDVRKDLGAAIGTMSERSAATLKEGSEKLEGATREISSALGVLSESVKETMGEVKASIGQALEIQKKSSVEFTVSAQTLNEQVMTTKLFTENLGKEIQAGLSSVAASGQHMRSIGKSLERQIPVLERIASQEDSAVLTDILREIEALGALHMTLVPLVQDDLLRKQNASGSEAP